MTDYLPWRRELERHTARQLRAYPPRLWPLIDQEHHAALLLYEAHGRPCKTAPMVLDLRTRIEAA